MKLLLPSKESINQSIANLYKREHTVSIWAFNDTKARRTIEAAWPPAAAAAIVATTL
jgi:hypothetical protein